MANVNNYCMYKEIRGTYTKQMVYSVQLINIKKNSNEILRLD